MTGFLIVLFVFLIFLVVIAYYSYSHKKNFETKSNTLREKVAELSDKELVRSFVQESFKVGQQERYGRTDLDLVGSFHVRNRELVKRFPDKESRLIAWDAVRNARSLGKKYSRESTESSVVRKYLNNLSKKTHKLLASK